jgi:hypothetical protein
MDPTPGSSPSSGITSELKDALVPRPPAGSSPIKSFLLFDWMITPVLIRVIYVLGSLAVIVTALQTMFSKSPADEMADAFRGLGVRAPASGGGGNFWQGLIYLVVGLVAVRVWCELMIVFFRMHENLKAIRDRHAV